MARGLLAAVTATVVAATASASPELRASGPWFLDPDDRVVILRGVGVAGNAKVPPFVGIASPDELDGIAGRGLNAIRLVFTWEAYEPAPGQYDAAYLDALAIVAAEAWARGLYVILDVHQDGFSRFSIGGCGDGFPAWALPSWQTPDPPDNGEGCADWATRMPLDLAMHEAFEHFYADTEGVRTRYLQMLANLAARFVSNPGVVGYDLLNEPWGWEAGEIAPLYEDAAVAVRAVDPTAILFVSPHVATDPGLQTTLPRPTFGNFAYAPHFYDPSVHQLHIWLGNPLDFPFWLMASKASEWNVPLFLGEFGAAAGTVNGLDYVDALYEQLDARILSGAQWNYTPGWTPAAKDGWNDEDLSIVDDAGSSRANFRMRPYPQKVAGTPVDLSVRVDGNALENFVELEWLHDPAKEPPRSSSRRTRSSGPFRSRSSPRARASPAPTTRPRAGSTARRTPPVPSACGSPRAAAVSSGSRPERCSGCEPAGNREHPKRRDGMSTNGERELRDRSEDRRDLTRRDFLKGAAGSSAAFYAGVSGLGLAGTLAGTSGCVGLTDNQRKTLRSVWDAIVPGLWEGVVQDELSPGVTAPGPNNNGVQQWIEAVADTLPPPLDFLTTTFQRTWSDDLNIWSDAFHGWPGDGAPKFWELPLGPSVLELGRQHKLILMQALFGTLIDVKYQAGIILAKVAFYCDFFFEYKGWPARVGRSYIGFPLPPGTTPYTDFSYQQVLGDPDPRMVVVGPNALLALP